MTQVAPPEGEDLCAGAGTARWKSFNRDLKAKGITAGSCDEPGGGTSVFALARSLGLLRQWSGGVLCSSRDTRDAMGWKSQQRLGMVRWELGLLHPQKGGGINSPTEVPVPSIWGTGRRSWKLLNHREAVL